jgi:tripartite-type tricarboxylate transporter receptor subunit TctC
MKKWIFGIIAAAVAGLLAVFVIAPGIFNPGATNGSSSSPEITRTGASGVVKVLATTTDKRLSLRPDLPTISEAGVPGYAASVWFGLAATAGTPEPVLTKIHAEVVKTLADPVYRAKFVTAQSLEPGGMSRAEFAALLKSEEVRWGQLVRESGAKIE